jgi:hypothetical protein
MLYGTGPFINQHSTIFIGTNGYGDLTANRNYWLTQDNVIAALTNIFHEAGDVDYNGRIDINDLAAVSLAYYTEPGDLQWNPDADVNGDNIVNIYDISIVGRFYGQTLTGTLGPSQGPESPAPTPVIFADPPLVTNVSPGETFAVNIRIRDADSVYTWQFDLVYDPEVLSVTNVIEGDFLASAAGFEGTCFVIGPSGADFRIVGCAIKGDYDGASGNGVLATVVFRVLKEGKSPISLGTKLRGHYMGETELWPIGHATENGYYQTYAAKVYVDPVTIVGSPPQIGETFTVNVQVADVHDLYVWQAGLTFNATVCEALSIEEGEFLKRAGVTTLWTPGTINNGIGKISYSACSLTGPTPGVSGSGQLMNATFRIKQSGDAKLNLTDVLLLDSNMASITPVKIMWATHARIIDVGIGGGTTTIKYLYVNQHVDNSGDWTNVGTSPYLNGIGDGSYIRGIDYCQLSDIFGFEDISLGPYDRIKEVRLQGYTKSDSTDIDFDMYVWDSFTWLGSLWGETSWSWKDLRWETRSVSTIVPSTLTQGGLNAFQVLAHYYTQDGSPMGNADLDALRLVVQIEEGPEPFDTVEVYPTWTRPLDIGVVIENQGTQTETFAVTAYANTTSIDGTKTISLAAGTRTAVVFNWNVNGFPEGTYTIRAEASVVEGDTETPSCLFIDGTVKVKHPGDANGDGVLNAYDLGILAKAWGTSYGDPLFDSRADFNGDLMINQQDHDILKAYWP